MDRAYASGAAGTPPAAPGVPSIGYPQAANPGIGVQATKPGPYWYHMITEELRAVVAAGGLAPDRNVLNQLVMAMQAAGYSMSAAGGTADALTGTFTPAIAALTNGMLLYVRAGSANTTATPTFTPDGLAAKAIVKGNNLALAAGDIAGDGHWIGLRYDSTLDNWVLSNPYTSVVFSSAAENAAGAIENKAVDPLGIREAFNALGSAPIFACRAWVNFNGTGTVAIRASGNVSSITDNGEGDYTANFITAMPDANYAYSARGISSTIASWGSSSNGAVLLAGSLRFQGNRDSAGGLTDSDNNAVSVFR